MNSLKKFIFLIVIGVSLPQFALAAPKNFKELIDIFLNIIQSVIPVVVGLAVLAFFWGLAKYIFSQGNENIKIEGKNIMVWGLVGLFFIFSVYGVVRLFGSILPKFPSNPTPTYNRDPAPEAFRQE